MFPDKYNLSLKENIFLAKKVLGAQIHNLSRFENCQTTLLQTEQIINGQNIASVSLNDIQTILNLKRAYQYVIRHISDGFPVDISLLKKSTVSLPEKIHWLPEIFVPAQSALP